MKLGVARGVVSISILQLKILPNLMEIHQHEGTSSLDNIAHCITECFMLFYIGNGSRCP